MRTKLRSCIPLPALLASMLLLPIAPAAVAQPKPSSAPFTASGAPLSDDELASVREQLIGLLRMSPTLVQVVETDPTLLADQEYIAHSNPQLAQFLSQHPEISRNPDFYLFAELPRKDGRNVDGLRRRMNGNPPPTEAEMQRQARREYMGDLLGTLAFATGAGAFLWLIRILLENRRWSRVFRLQSEIHGKLIDRFASNQEVLHYMETEPGKRFLEAAPIPVGFERSQRLPGGVARVLGPLQIGIVLTLLGLGLLILHYCLLDIADPLLVFSMITLMPGLGFIISAIVSWRISERLGLMPQPAAPPTDRQ
jgi:hypothetical protein